MTYSAAGAEKSNSSRTVTPLSMLAGGMKVTCMDGEDKYCRTVLSTNLTSSGMNPTSIQVTSDSMKLVPITLKTSRKLPSQTTSQPHKTQPKTNSSKKRKR